MIIYLNECKNLEILKEEIYSFSQYKKLNKGNKRLSINFKEDEKTYSFKEFKLLNSCNYDMDEWDKLNPASDNFDINRVDYWIGRLKNDSELHKKAISYLAVGLQILSIATSTTCFAESSIVGLEPAFNSILNILFDIAQYSFLALGIKEAVIKILNGGTVKDAIQSSLQYAFGFLFLKLYPTIYDKFAKIKF